MSSSESDSDSESFELDAPVPAVPSSVASPSLSQQRQFVGRVPPRYSNLSDRPEVSPTARKPDHVHYHFDISMPESEMLKSRDRGQSIELRLGNGITKVEYSNPSHRGNKELAKRPCNILEGTWSVTQENTLGEMLNISTNIPAPGSLNGNGSAAAGEEAPNGFLNANVPHGKPFTRERVLTPEARRFLEKFPGQTAEDQDDFVYATAKDENLAHINVKGPKAATIDYYNDHEEIKKSKNFITDSHADAKGIAYANRKIAFEAKEQCKQAIRSEITYFDVSRPENIVFTVSLPPTNIRLNGVQVSKKPSIAAVFGQRVNGTKRANEVRDRDQLMFRIRGVFTIPYITVMPDFE
jgi:hypothetical protein